MDEQTAQPTHYLIPASLLQATLDYLAKRPFVEVADAILALRNLEPHTSGAITIGPPPEEEPGE